MGSYKEIKGDLLEMARNGDFQVIAHGANCKKIMGAGIAWQIANQFPEAYERDKNDKRSPLQRWGDLTSVTYNIGDKLLSIYNLYTQFEPGPNLDYSALELSLKKFARKCSTKIEIGLPLIGCGIGGGNEEIIINIIKEVLKEESTK